MAWIAPIIEWCKSHDAILFWVFVGSAILFLVTPIAVAWAVIRLPADYFAQPARRPLETLESHRTLRPILLVAKNILGALLLIAGLAMLVLPGQGLLTIVVGVALLDFPGKFRLQRWLATRPAVWRSLNWLRSRASRPKLVHPEIQTG
jgi:hypothetical protein